MVKKHCRRNRMTEQEVGNSVFLQHDFRQHAVIGHQEGEVHL